ncbi:hypothetical protein [Helicobacter sp. TUL]|nr:hypothetical protein B9T66_08320 [Helicobacter sp. TUL]
MQFLKILYICWVVFWAFGCILGGVMAYDDGKLGVVVFLFVILVAIPLFIYASSILLIYTFKKSKILFSLTFIILFAVYGVLCLYLTQNNTIITITFIMLSYAIIILVKLKGAK